MQPTDTIYVYCPANTVCEPASATVAGSRDRPVVTLNRAVILAELAGADTIAVAGRGADQAYDETLELTRGIRILGGYSPDFSERDPLRFPTLIRSEQSRTLTVFATVGMQIEGLTIEGRGERVEQVVSLGSANDTTLRDVTVRVTQSDPAPETVIDRVTAVSIEDSSVSFEGVTIDVESATFPDNSPIYLGVLSERSALAVADSTVTVRGTGRAQGILSIQSGALDIQRSEVSLSLELDPSAYDRLTVGVSCNDVDCIIADSAILGGARALRVSGAPVASIERNVIGTLGCETLDTFPFFSSRVCYGVFNSDNRCEGALRVVNNVIFAEGEYAVAFETSASEPQTVAHNTFFARGNTLSAASMFRRSSNDIRGDFSNNVFYAATAPTAGCLLYQPSPESRDGPTALRNNLFACDLAMLLVEGGSTEDATTDTAIEAVELFARDGTSIDGSSCGETMSEQTRRFGGNLSIEPPSPETVFVDRMAGDWRLSAEIAELVDDAGIDTVTNASCGSDEIPRDCGAVRDTFDGQTRTEPASIGPHEFD
ncbi:MAG: hypothetical protein AAF654_03470 [Myxococcota bacterium]